MPLSSAPTVALLALLALLPAAAAQSSQPTAACLAAYAACPWTFATSVNPPVIDMSLRADSVITPRIMSKNASEYIGIVNTNQTADVIMDDGTTSPIDRFAWPRFAPSHLKPFSRMDGTSSGLGHETFVGNQLRVASGSCLRLYFTAYQKLDAVGGSVVDNVVAGRADGVCVVIVAAK